MGPIVCAACGGVPVREGCSMRDPHSEWIREECDNCRATPGFETCQVCGDAAAVYHDRDRGYCCSACAAVAMVA